MKDSLGDRMKANYENCTRTFLMRRAYTIIRINGKAFHSYTRGLDRPFDMGLIEDMDKTACHLCKEISGAKFAFVQSDEISILLTDFDNLQTQAWFDNNLQKMASVSASIATVAFNQARLNRTIYENKHPMKWAEFDSRVFQLPYKDEVANYFIWRQQDTTRNSISSVAQSLYSPKELHGMNSDQMQEMIFQKGINWNDYKPKLKRGRIIVKEEYEVEVRQQTAFEEAEIAIGVYKRTHWVSKEVPVFTQEPEFLKSLIPGND